MNVCSCTAFPTANLEQIPPVYSAVKVDGERAYKKARKNESEIKDEFKTKDDASTEEEIFKRRRFVVRANQDGKAGDDDEVEENGAGSKDQGLLVSGIKY